MQTAHASLLGLLLLAITASAQIPTQVIQLHHGNFEHDTQAATGQTTGHWLVLFNSRLSRWQHHVAGLWQKLAADEDKEVILAEVDVDDPENLFLARRFSDVQPPAAVLFRDRAMFVYPGSLTVPDAVDKLREFWQGGYEQTAKQHVPGGKPLPTQEEVEAGRETQQRNLLIGLGLLIGGLVIRGLVSKRTGSSGKQAAGGSKSVPATAAAAGKKAA